MRAILLTSIVVVSGCTDPPSPIGRSFRAQVKIAVQTAGCPKFDGLSAMRYERDVSFSLERDSIGFGRATTEPYDVVVSEPDDGVCSVSFTVGESWKIGTSMYPVLTTYVGIAKFDQLDLRGTVSFPQPDPVTDGCAMTTTIWGYDD